jgi:hypothetical protein
MYGDPLIEEALKKIRADSPPESGDETRRAVLRARIDQLISDWYA